MIDIVIPDNNEEEFIQMAEMLGFDELCFLYDFNMYPDKQKFEMKNKKIKIYPGIVANDRDVDKIKNKLNDRKIIVAIKSSNKTRDIIEGSKADIIFSLEDSPKRDFIHQRASGLNHILCKLANKNKVIVGFSLSSILNSKNVHETLGRITQNIKLCRKFKVKTIIASFASKPYDMRSAHDLKSLFKILGCKNPKFLNGEIEDE